MLVLSKQDVNKIQKMRMLQKKILITKRLTILLLIVVIVYGVAGPFESLYRAGLMCVLISLVMGEIYLVKYDHFNLLLDIINYPNLKWISDHEEEIQKEIKKNKTTS